jgi:antitoxin ParD1/3/4
MESTVTRQDTAEQARIKSLREAVQVGIADIEAGRYRTFNTRDELRRHLASIADEVLESFRTRVKPNPSS